MLQIENFVGFWSVPCTNHSDGIASNGGKNYKDSSRICFADLRIAEAVNFVRLGFQIKGFIPDYFFGFLSSDIMHRNMLPIRFIPIKYQCRQSSAIKSDVRLV